MVLDQLNTSLLLILNLSLSLFQVLAGLLGFLGTLCNTLNIDDPPVLDVVLHLSNRLFVRLDPIAKIFGLVVFLSDLVVQRLLQVRS